MQSTTRLSNPTVNWPLIIACSCVCLSTCYCPLCVGVVLSAVRGGCFRGLSYAVLVRNALRSRRCTRRMTAIQILFFWHGPLCAFSWRHLGRWRVLGRGHKPTPRSVPLSSETNHSTTKGDNLWRPFFVSAVDGLDRNRQRCRKEGDTKFVASPPPLKKKESHGQRQKAGFLCRARQTQKWPMRCFLCLFLCGFHADCTFCALGGASHRPNGRPWRKKKTKEAGSNDSDKKRQSSLRGLSWACAHTHGIFLSLDKKHNGHWRRTQEIQWHLNRKKRDKNNVGSNVYSLGCLGFASDALDSPFLVFLLWFLYRLFLLWAVLFWLGLAMGGGEAQRRASAPAQSPRSCRANILRSCRQTGATIVTGRGAASSPLFICLFVCLFVVQLLGHTLKTSRRAIPVCRRLRGPVTCNTFCLTKSAARPPTTTCAR
ncbi:hypothetical protein TW95_gp1813 [Pandoravirus inopinatum]|uniref:Uncharacterized protein n=1 Tax=Pandoravirus inopinatum TaxID=1605721 RepID=A0A0B5JFC1_9VIRU|nr:hypothetical protein TW95_gp1813 [Pandoravirus inopinatum]AJF98547.1 hypothetical protein [Pandoravirus inopinatum]